MKHTLAFIFEESTKRTHRYTEVGNEPIVGTLYVRKTSVGETPPQRVLVTLDFQ